MDFGGGEDIRFEKRGRAGIVTLTRPKALNAVTYAMFRALTAALAAWRDDDAVALVLLKAEGRAFSAGGDLMEVYNAVRARRPMHEFFAHEYGLNAAIPKFPKPWVALVNGIVMGGGVGISMHGSHRIFTENAVFAMPEVSIGFFPDAGGSHLLSGLPGEFGTYLGLTGNRIRQGDALWSGLATHCVPSSELDGLVEEAIETGDIDAALRKRCVTPPRETDDASLHVIAKHFGLETVQDIAASLRQDADRGDEIARAMLDTLLARSPTSLHVARRQIAAGAVLDMDECMKMEFRIANHMMQSHDFPEGIRCVLVDKGAVPQWRPATIDEVRDEDVEAYFSPPAAGDLKL